ncbi:glycosyltransferase family 2 protein [Klebsiella oxytoca]
MEKQNIFLSIIIAAHNSDSFIRETLCSLLDALGENIVDCEVIMINDASTDNTGAILNEFVSNMPQARYFEVNFKNIGKVRNYGVSKCCGQYITMLDSDDLLKKNSFNEILSFLKKKSPDLLLNKLHEVRDLTITDISWKGLKPERLTIEEAISRFLKHKDFQSHLIGQFFKRSIIQNVSFPEFVCYEDFYIFPELLKKSKIIFYSTESNYLYIKRNASLSSSPSTEKVLNLISCLERMERAFEQKYYDLILCHWLDLRLKRMEWISNPVQRKYVEMKVRRIYRIGFFVNPMVRFSYKRKAIELLWKK